MDNNLYLLEDEGLDDLISSLSKCENTFKSMIEMSKEGVDRGEISYVSYYIRIAMWHWERKLMCKEYANKKAKELGLIDCEDLDLDNPSLDLDNPSLKWLRSIKYFYDKERSSELDNYKKVIQHRKECKADEYDWVANAFYFSSSRDSIDVKERRRCYMAAMAHSDLEHREFVRLKYDVSTCFILNSFDYPQNGTSFSDIAYHERQFIYIAKDVDALAGCYDDCIQWLFTIDALPKELHFPVGHPLPNSLYYAHPAKKGEYLPIENAEEELCNDKVRDFQRLVQCLGATDIKYRLVKGQSLSDKYSGNTNVKAGADYKVFKGNAEYNGQRSGSRDESMNGQHEIVLHFNPNKAPYIPDDIKGWLSVDPDWESLRKQRFEGNMLEYRVRISSRKTMAVSESRMDEVKVAFKSFIAKAHLNFSQQMERSFQREEETEWEYYVKFKPLNELGANFTKDEPKKTDTEQQYLDTLCEFMEDDSEITPRERKMLDRIRQSLGISEERAMELEASLAKPQLTEDEQEYLEMFHEYVKKGEITAKERRKLEMSANAMGISQSRVQELEKL